MYEYNIERLESKIQRSYSLFVTHMTGIEQGIKNRWKLFPYEHIEFP